METREDSAAEAEEYLVTAARARRRTQGIHWLRPGRPSGGVVE
jgi:hypothetical protein